MTELDKIDALFAVAKKHGYRVGTIQVSESGVFLEGLSLLAPDAEEEAIVEARGSRIQTKERLEEDRRLLGIR